MRVEVPLIPHMVSQGDMCGKYLQQDNSYAATGVPALSGPHSRPYTIVLENVLTSANRHAYKDSQKSPLNFHS